MYKVFTIDNSDLIQPGVEVLGFKKTKKSIKPAIILGNKIIAVVPVKLNEEMLPAWNDEEKFHVLKANLEKSGKIVALRPETICTKAEALVIIKTKAPQRGQKLQGGYPYQEKFPGKIINHGTSTAKPKGVGKSQELICLIPKDKIFSIYYNGICTNPNPKYYKFNGQQLVIVNGFKD